jgi:hypothetical protein
VKRGVLRGSGRGNDFSPKTTPWRKIIAKGRDTPKGDRVKEPHPRTIRKLAQALEVDPAELIE